ncbi:MAG: (d)CMP kinase [Planctomycetota bacterium]|jgi:cytidylate kinase
MRAVSIDGPAGSGKSTVGRELARRLGWLYIDTGAMYRAVTLKAIREGVDLENAAGEQGEALARVARKARIDLREGPAGQRVALDGEDVTDEIRSPELTRLVRFVARCGQAREEMVKKQRALAESGGIVMEGRDIGTVVLPEAVAKFYLDARAPERARRRAVDLERTGAEVDPARLEEEIASRDRSDRERADGPLRAADDAEVVDTTGMTFEQVVGRLEERTRERLAGLSPTPGGGG